MADRRRGLASLAGALALAAVASLAPSAGAATAAQGSSGSLTATFAAGGHTPKINQQWQISVTAKLNGKPVAATALYEFLYAGQLVQAVVPFGARQFSFTGQFADQLKFPPASAGQPLTLRVVVKAKGHTVNLNWSVTPHR